ncbi:MAG TPA: UDP-N-acetylglucosamine 2-epimerase (non-hydrolyzing) [Telluria sp.]
MGEPERHSGGAGGGIVCVVGARPNFMKIAPLMAAFARMAPALPVTLVHTGQHYDNAMNCQFFDALGIPRPDIDLEVGSGSHAVQTAEVMRRFEPALDAAAPCAVLVVGDVNSTLACALVAAKKAVPVIHVEAGLRSGDRSMPEEINRILTDHVSDLLFTTEESARANLLGEGIAGHRIHFVGNVMIDTLRANLPRAIPAAQTAERHGRPGFGSGPAGYSVLTLHRPSNVDQPAVLRTLVETCARLAERTPMFFPVHPRTRVMIESAGLAEIMMRASILPLPPQGYLEMLGLMEGARVVLTDSGGVQEETTALGTPCITLRESTERPVTVTEGTNTIAGRDPRNIFAAFDRALASGRDSGRVPRYWDGHASERIVAAVMAWLEMRKAAA